MCREYDVFVENLRQLLLEQLGLEERQIFFREREEQGMTPDGDRLFVECNAAPAGKEVCGLHTEELFEEYQNGMPLEKISDRIEKEICKLKNAGFFEKTQNLDNYDKVKKDLFVRLLNRKRHQRELSKAVYRVIGDIALVLYMQIGQLNGCTTSIKVPGNCVKNWGMEESTVFENALLNTYFISPPRIFLWEKLIGNPMYNGECFMDLNHDYQLKRDSIGNCLSTARRTNGAVAAFLPGVARRIADLMDADFYLVFTSIHEVMIHNVNLSYPEDLEVVLKDTIREATPDEDFLTDKVYRYCRETGDFMMYQGASFLDIGSPHKDKEAE